MLTLHFIEFPQPPLAFDQRGRLELMKYRVKICIVDAYVYVYDMIMFCAMSG